MAQHRLIARYGTSIRTENGFGDSQSEAPARQVSRAENSVNRAWEVGGRIEPAGVHFWPLFELPVQATSETGTGSHALEVQDANGKVLYTRRFTPREPIDESIVADSATTSPEFSQHLPVVAGTSRIVLKDLFNSELGRIVLTGAKPTVAVTSPGPGFVPSGEQDISWTIDDPDSAAFVSRLYYSRDGGATWEGLMSEYDPLPDRQRTATVDYDQLPGSAQPCLIRAVVTDGVNTAYADSAPFTLPKKAPELVAILSPQENTIQRIL